jgi:LAO/AO transport system kinase
LASVPTDPAVLASAILDGDTRAIARAATLIENHVPAGRALVQHLFPHTGQALMVGITGPPGAGKSTLASQLIRVWRQGGRKVGVLAVDPSSPFTHGAILGDRVRMQEHHQDPGVFIRSLATRGRLGGVAESTMELALLLDAAAFDVILIETVGVGQDEIEVSRLADVTVLVLTPGFGDDVQAIKAGIMEVADIFAINKSDLPGADRLEQEIRAMQSLGDPLARRNAAPVRRVVATEGTGVADLVSLIEETHRAGDHPHARVAAWEFRLQELLLARVVDLLDPSSITAQAQRVASGQLDPFLAVDELLEALAERTNPAGQPAPSIEPKGLQE